MKNPLDSRGVCDSRDLIEYKESLETEILDEYIEWVEDFNNSLSEEDEMDEMEIPNSYQEAEFIEEEAFTTTCQDLVDQYEAISDFCEELSAADDFEYGATIIGEDYFEEYCQDFVREVGYLPKDLPDFIESAIDWGQVANEMRYDYVEADFESNTYIIR